MHEGYIRRLYSILGHAGYYSRVGSLDCQSKKYEDGLLYGIDEVLEYATKWNGIRNVFIGRNPRDISGLVIGSHCISLDIDPIRTSGEAANDEQHNQAIEAGRRILNDYPGGFLCSSGNGCLLLYPANIELDALEEYYKKEKEFIRTLQTKVDTLNVKIDHTSYEEAVIKLIGTQSTKGDSKYHRLSRFIICSNTCQQSPIITQIQSITTTKESATDMDRFNGNPIERLRKAQECLQKLGKDYYDNYEKWVQVGMVCKEFGLSGLQLWKEWSKKSEKYEEGICEAKWPTFDEVPSLTLATLIKWSEESRSIPINVVRDGYFEGLFSRDSRFIQPILTGISGIDTHLRGLPRGEITCIAARSGFGKTSFAVTVSEFLRKQGSRVLYFSTEVAYNYIMHKFVSVATGIETQKLIEKSFCATDALNIDKFKQEWEKNPIIISDEFSPKIELVKELIEQHKPDILVFDHATQSGTHWEYVAQFVRGLKEITAQYGLITLLASQLNEPPRGSKGEVGSSVRGDLRGSQEILFLSAIFMMLNNIYETKGDIQPVELEICKNRFGISGIKVEIHVDKKIGRYTN